MAGLTNGSSHGTVPPLLYIDLAYDYNNSESTLRELIYTIRPEWRECADQLDFVKFTDGITNTLLKVARTASGMSPSEIDEQSILMRAYGNNTDIIIDRDREAKSHALLAEQGMAPPLLARFRNGLLYRYIAGAVATPEHLTQKPVWRGVARKLGEWHARTPIEIFSEDRSDGKPVDHPGYPNGLNGHSHGTPYRQRAASVTFTRLPRPNLWSVLQKWVDALSTSTEKERSRKAVLQQEIDRSFEELDNKNGLGEHGLVFGHCDLLSANVIMLPKPDATVSSVSPTPSSNSEAALPVAFIDYEYATPCPAAFDIANHFAEWVGYDLDYSRLPTRAVRRAFLQEYVAAYDEFARVPINQADTVQRLYDEIEHYRGMPGLYWGIWSLIQAKISQIDFDYTQYAEDRLSEYWAWRAASAGTEPPAGKAVPAREARWNQE